MDNSLASQLKTQTDRTPVSGPTTWQAVQSDIITLIKECSGASSMLEKKEVANRKETGSLLLNMVEVLDAFDRVFQNIEPKAESTDKQTKIWIGNFKAVRRELLNKLREAGVVPLETPSGKAIPGFHTIVETRRVENMEDDSILEEVEKGYVWRDRVLRKAKVITVKN